ncbi:MAG: hypothetical protein KDA37_13145, partial [Planctomycetales bacterium]|nr:hypothetical protein [Planctomycetales bacterium]
PGDYNGDASVDAADYTVWRDALGEANPAADGDGDGLVDQDDYGVWRDNYGVTPDLSVPNGDFETGDLSEWEVVVEPNTDVSSGFPRVESFDVNGDGQPTDAMRVRLGRFDAGSPGGVVALEQELLLAAGDYEFSADVASQSLQSFGNTGPGDYVMYLDGEVLDEVLLNGTTIDGFEVIRQSLYGALQGVQPGYHTLRLEVSRGATNSREIYHFFDNIAFAPLLSSATAAPEPHTAGLLVLGAWAIGAGRRQRAAS